MYGGPSGVQAYRQLEQPIFLFIRPPRSDLAASDASSLYYWCFDEDGQNALSPDICDELGLPNDLKLSGVGYLSCSWPTNTYKQMHTYQHLRGFNVNVNPASTDFARDAEYNTNTFQPLIRGSNHPARFEEVHDSALD